VNISHIFIVVIWWVSDMELSTYHLKNHLQDTPLHDWILLHGKKWLHEHSDVFQEIYGTPEEAEAFHLQTELQTLQRKLQYDCDDGAHIPIHTFNTFYEHVLNSCYAKNIPPPQRINHNVFSSSVASIDQQHDTYVIVQSVSLKAPFSIDKQNVRLKVQPDILLSRPLATLLFQHQLPPKCTTTLFSRWVPIFFTTTGKAGLLTHTARSSKYDAMCFQVCQHVLKQWTSDSRNEANVPCIAGIVLNVKSFANSRFYVYQPPSMILSSNAQLQPKPYDWISALEWAVCVRKHGQLWDPVLDTEHKELCMPVESSGVGEEWQPFVQWLAEKRNDMCLVYKVSVKQREKAWKIGARTYHDLWDRQNECKPLKLHPLSLNIIWANHRRNPEKQMVVPRKLTRPEHRDVVMHSQQHPYFIVDFETIRSEWIFMVATVYYNPLTQKRCVFTEQMHQLTDDEQVSMLHRWVSQMNALIAPADKPHLFHWSAAEPQFLKSLFRKHPTLLQRMQTRYPKTTEILTTSEEGLHWTDLCNIFLKEPITVPTCFDFQLKHIIKALVRLGLLRANNVWEEGGVQDGRTAMQMAERAYKENTPSVFETIQKYNEADVLVLHDLLVEVLWKMV
jgi:hypothetical protein